MYGVEREAEETGVMQDKEHDVGQVEEVQTSHRLHEQRNAQTERGVPQTCREGTDDRAT